MTYTRIIMNQLPKYNSFNDKSLRYLYNLYNIPPEYECYSITDLRKYNKRYFGGNNWINVANKLMKRQGRDLFEVSDTKAFISVEWCKKNVPDPNNDWYCYW